MTEFETTAELNVSVKQQSLREARDDVEQSLGSVSVGVEDGRATARPTDGGSSLADAGLVSLAEDRNDLLEDLIDEVEEGNAGLTAGGGNGGGGLFPVPTGIPSSGGILSKFLPFLNAAALRSPPGGPGGVGTPLIPGELFSGIAKQFDPDVFENFGDGEAPTSILTKEGRADRLGELAALGRLASTPALATIAGVSTAGSLVGADTPPGTGGKQTLAPGATPSGSLLSGNKSYEELVKEAERLQQRGQNNPLTPENKLQLDVTDRQLIQRLVDRGKIEADSALARLAENDNREFSLNEADRELFERMLARSRSGSQQPDTGTDTDTSSVEVGRIADQLPPSVRDAASTFLGGAARPFDLPASGSGSGSDTPQRVTLDVGPIELPVDSRRIDQKIDELGAQLKEETKREIRRELTTDVGGR